MGSFEPQARTDILVVDDEDDIRSALQEIFSDEGYVTAGATNGLEALEVLRVATALPSLILLDLTMPEMDGWEFLMHIDDDPRLHRIPVALMSAHPSVRRALEQHRKEGRPIRMLFPKPLNILRLLSTVRQFCTEEGRREPVDPSEEGCWSVQEAPTARFRPIRA